MSYSHDLDSVCGQTKHDTEGKSFHEEALSIRNIFGPNGRTFSYLFDSTIKLGKEGICYGGTSFAIPLSCCPGFRNSFGMDVYR
jgi:hypothetical protein